MKEGRKPTKEGRKPLATSFTKCNILKPEDLSPTARLEPAQ